MKPDLWLFEKRALRKGYSLVAGIDEAGRGPLAGPVVSAAVIFPDAIPEIGINDSKKLSPRKREYLFDIICEYAVSFGIGVVGHEKIDQINILQAALCSMSQAVETLNPVPDYLLVDGTFGINSDLPQQTIPKGDSLSISIAAASILAKVTRDRIMEAFHNDYPQYGFNSHKGYPTRLHKDAIKKHGPCPIHRRSFKGVKEYMQL
jgi:ribonuclease HII